MAILWPTSDTETMREADVSCLRAEVKRLKDEIARLKNKERSHGGPLCRKAQKCCQVKFTADCINKNGKA
jgi:hypothetical protein